MDTPTNQSQPPPPLPPPHALQAVDALEVVKVQRDDGSLDPAQDPQITDELAVSIYRHMVLVRILDEQLVMLQRQGRIGFHVGCYGEEAAILGAAAALRPQDWLFPCYREFGAALWRGMSLETYANNMFGNAKDPARGRQMSDHYTARSAKFVSVSSPVGTQITQAVGFAWAAKLKKDDLVALVYFGDGATSSAEFHNGLNFAGVFKTPSIFFCRNNGWAISVPAERQTASATFADKGIAYGVPAVRCDGNDVFAVMKVTRDAVARAAAGQGPTLIEALTYRLSGHSTSDDPKAYRRDEVVEVWKKRDPLLLLRNYLVRRGVWNDAKQADHEARVDVDLRKVLAEAERTQLPPLESMLEDVYAELPWHLREQQDELLRGPRPKAR
jgi:2-oxoisovalerate dehydrogenase E1 component alpha subunit